MRMGSPVRNMLFAGVLGVAMGGCSTSSDGGAQGSGGKTGSGGAGGAATSAAGGASGGAVGSGGSAASGGAVGSGGSVASGGTSASGGTTASGGAKASGGSQAGGSQGSGGQSAGTGGDGGRSTQGTGGATSSTGTISATGGTAAGGSTGTTPGSGGSGGSTGTGTGTCVASKTANAAASGSGPHKVVVETNADTGIKEGTIYRPADLGGTEKYPILAWGEGGCSKNGLDSVVAMGELASHGYFVIADGTPGGSGSRTQDTSKLKEMGQPLVDYITWAIAENEKPCSAYYHSLDTSKVSTNGFSCGGLMSEGAASDPRLTTWELNSSGLFAEDQTFYKGVHTPVLLVLGGSSDGAYPNGTRDYNALSAMGIPIMFFSKNLGHGGDLGTKGGDFAKIDLAWLNWWLKGDEGATGKGVLVGSGCTYCKDSSWEVKSKNLP